MTVNVIQDILKALAAKQDLSEEQAARAFQIIMNGGATPAQMGAFLMGLRLKGETPTEIKAGAEVLRIKAPRVNAPANAIDVCGTGGDGKNTPNISTAVAFVVAACGVPVVKHGNRAVSSSSGSADVLKELGVLPSETPKHAEHCLQKANMCFMHAQYFHTAMRHVAPVRQELSIRSIFNLLGPLSNPAQPKYQMLGVYSKEWVRPVAEVLLQLGLSRAWVVHSTDGMDELSTHSPSYVAELKDGIITEFMLSPEEAGFVQSAEPLRGGDCAYNAQILRELLLGMKNSYRDVVILNSAASLIIAGKASSLTEGAELAAAAIDNGHAYKTLQKLIEASRA